VVDLFGLINASTCGDQDRGHTHCLRSILSSRPLLNPSTAGREGRVGVPRANTKMRRREPLRSSQACTRQRRTAGAAAQLSSGTASKRTMRAARLLRGVSLYVLRRRRSACSPQRRRKDHRVLHDHRPDQADRVASISTVTMSRRSMYQRAPSAIGYLPRRPPFFRG